MSSWARWATSLVLIAALAALTVPAAIHFGPSLAAAVDPEPAPSPRPAQQPPTELGSTTLVTAPADPQSEPRRGVPFDPAALDAALNPAGPGNVTGIVTDPATGEVLYTRRADAGRIPASNLKLLTALTALKTLGAQTRFDTSVRLAPPEKDGTSPSTGRELVIVAGGDVLLGRGASDRARTMGHAGLATLAERTVSFLADAGVSGPVHVRVDDGLFTGPALNDHWATGDIRNGQIAPIAPMALNAARFDPEPTPGPRPEDPAMHAGRVFAEVLADAADRAGLAIDVADGVERGSAPDGSRQAATVTSATVAHQVAYMLTESDNYLAETLARLAAHASGRPASFDGAAAATRAVLTEAGIPTDGLRLADACGLSMDDRVSVRQLAAVVATMATSDDPDVRAALAGLPIAGLTGTLAERYRGPATDAAAGLVRAKTGTLNTVQSLSGTVVNAGGRLLVFSFVANGFSQGSQAAKPALDAAAALVATSHDDLKNRPRSPRADS